MPKLGSLRKGFSRSARKSAREILHSIRTERHFPFQPITSGVSPLAQDCSESTIPQRYFRRSHCSARRTSWWWVTIVVVMATLAAGKYLRDFGAFSVRVSQQLSQGRLVLLLSHAFAALFALHGRRRADGGAGHRFDRLGSGEL